MTARLAPDLERVLEAFSVVTVALDPQSMRTHIVDTAKAAQGQLDTLRLRAMYAGDAAAAAGGGFKGMSAAVGGVKGAASGLLGVLGGPWGAAFTGATMTLGANWSRCFKMWMPKRRALATS